MATLAALVAAIAYLALGRFVYLHRWPKGVLPHRVDEERDRWRRQRRIHVAMPVDDDNGEGS